MLLKAELIELELEYFPYKKAFCQGRSLLFSSVIILHSRIEFPSIIEVMYIITYDDFYRQQKEKKLVNLFVNLKFDTQLKTEKLKNQIRLTPYSISFIPFQSHFVQSKHLISEAIICLFFIKLRSRNDFFFAD